MMEWIVSSSALILGVLALRRVLQGHISLRLQYALWLLVLLRLLTPVNLFQSRTVETVTDFILGGSKITADGDRSHEIKRLAPWKTSYD